MTSWVETTRLVAALFLVANQFRHVLGLGVEIGNGRRYVLHLPPGYDTDRPLPLWLLAPGSGDTAEIFMNMSGLIPLTDKRGIACAGLEGKNDNFNVASHARPAPWPWMADDVAYTQEVLRDVASRVKIDRRLIRCVGFSRGGRFCSRLASEMSSFISAIAPVSGLRFPEPNNATRPVPIITFHGTADPINPFSGNGNPQYWHEPVLGAVQRWADRNGCKRYVEKRVTSRVTYCMHVNCTDGADVILVQIWGGGHTWPGTTWQYMPQSRYGEITHDIDSKVDILNFFKTHQPHPTCRTPSPGDPCYRHVMWVKRHGIHTQPELYDGLDTSASFEDIQAVIHKKFYANCPLPCHETVGKAKIRVEAFHIDVHHLRQKAQKEDTGKALPVVPHVWLGSFGLSALVVSFFLWRSRKLVMVSPALDDSGYDTTATCTNEALMGTE